MATRKKSELELLREELQDVKAGRPGHVHTPRDGSGSFRCVSPYCEDLGSAIPATSPAGREDPEQYIRGNREVVDA